MVRAVGYVRVSTKDQVEDGESLARQVAMIRSYCELKSYDLLEIIHDKGISGFKEDRPGYVRLLELCRTKTTDMVIVYDLSRLSRSLKGTLMFMEDFVQSGIVHFVSLTQDVNTSTASGKAFLAITGVFNQLYRDEISQKTRAALDHKKEKGLRYSGSIPYGFDLAEDDRLVISETDRELLAKVAQLHSSGLSLRAIGRELEAQGIATKKGKTHWNAKTIRALLART